MSNQPEQSSSPERKTMEIKDLPDRGVEDEAADAVRGGASIDPCWKPIAKTPTIEPCLRPISTRLV